MGEFIIAAAGGLVIFVALFGAAQVLDNVFHYTDKTLEVMERNPSTADAVPLPLTREAKKSPLLMRTIMNK